MKKRSDLPVFDQNVEIEKVVQGGFGFVRSPHGIVFVNDAYPGDIGRLVNIKKKKGVFFADFECHNTNQFSRIEVDCGVSDRCGGCDYLDVSPADRLALKKMIFLDQYERISRTYPEQVLNVDAIHFFERDYAEQSRRARLHVDTDGQIGFYGRGSRKVIEFDSCRRLMPALNQAIDDLKEQAVPTNTDLALLANQVGDVTLAITEHAHRFDMETWLSWCESTLEHTCLKGVSIHEADGAVITSAGQVEIGGVIGGKQHTVAKTHASLFAQGLYGAAEEIVDICRKGLNRISDKMGAPSVVELFSGSGELTLPLADLSASWHAIEGHTAAVHMLRQNIKEASMLEKVKAEVCFVDGRTFDLPKCDVVIADPPRKGFMHLDQLLLRQSVKPKYWFHISCDVATGLRDVSFLLGQGYVLNELHVLDAFNRTKHMEFVSILSYEN